MADWIQLVQMGRRDAVVSVQTHDGRLGRLWCHDGDIIDASCEGVDGEEAVYRILSWDDGKVVVDFRAFARPRQIPVATVALLLEAAYRRDSSVGEVPFVRRAPSSPPPPHAAASVSAPREWIPSIPPGKQNRRRRQRMVLAFAGALSVVAILIAGGIRYWTEPARRETATRAAPVAEFLVRVEVQPAHAEISLDGKSVAVGLLSKALPRDGRSHEIRFSSPGYVSERLVFRDTPPPPRVTLVRSSDTPSPAPVERTQTAPAPKVIQVYRAPAPARAAARPAKQPPPPNPPKLVAAKPDLRIVEVRHTRVQVIDERNSKIQVVE